jgi:hypothetical protein
MCLGFWEVGSKNVIAKRGYELISIYIWLDINLIRIYQLYPIGTAQRDCAKWHTHERIAFSIQKTPKYFGNSGSISLPSNAPSASVLCYKTRLLHQSLHFCTSKASKLSTCRPHPAGRGFTQRGCTGASGAVSKSQSSPPRSLSSSTALVYQQLRQYLYLCTSKAHKLSTCRAGGARSGVSICASLLALPVQKYKYWHLLVWAVADSTADWTAFWYLPRI